MKNSFMFILLVSYLVKYIIKGSLNKNIIINNNNLPDILLSQLNIIDKYKDFAFGAQLGANYPCEDKFFIQNITLLNYEGIFLSIFDGHGGDKLSKYSNLLLYPYFLERFNMNIFEQNLNKRIVLSLKQAYEKIEHEFIKIAFDFLINN